MKSNRLYLMAAFAIVNIWAMFAVIVLSVSAEAGPVPPTVPTERVYEARLVRVIDADTVELDVHLEFSTHRQVRIRLGRIQAVESRGPTAAEGKALTEKVRALFATSEGRCILTTEGKTTFNRYVGEVWIGDVNVSDWLHHEHGQPRWEGR